MKRIAKSYLVTKKTQESEIITSFYLKPEDGQLADVKPGQFLTFELDIDNVGMVRRTYSVSGWDDSEYRITIKREPSPVNQPDLPAGLVSNYFHDKVDTGTILKAYDPSGHFYLNDKSSRPVVLLSGGVGLTPLVAMAKELAKQGSRKTWFIHGSQNGRVHALKEEMKNLSQSHDNILTYFVYSNAQDSDTKDKDYDFDGVINDDVLRQLLPIDDYEFYLCGPPSFMQSVFDTLIAAGIREDHISYEFFGPATVLKSSKDAMPLASQTVQSGKKKSAGESEGLPMIYFTESDISVKWDPSFDNLLEFAESQGLSPDFSCRTGVCSTCECQIEDGELEYNEEPLEEPDEGFGLICCSKPKGNLKLKI